MIISKLKSDLPTVIDIFSGCGGMSLGFQKAGFRIAGSVDIDEVASLTASYNLHWKNYEEDRHFSGDIKSMNPTDLFGEVDGNDIILIGGPPCQAYSMAGRAKLKSLGADRVHINDERGMLFREFLRFADELDPIAIVMENVPESTDYGGINVPQYISEYLEGKGYEAYWTILNAADYGVPQIRERVFVIAIKAGCGEDWIYPKSTHKSHNGRLSKHEKRRSGYETYGNFKSIDYKEENLHDWVTVSEAISDLPVLFPNYRSRYSLDRMSTLRDYSQPAQNDYQRLMRSWYGDSTVTVTGSCFRKTARDFQTFHLMEEGDDYVAAVDIAEEIFRRECKIRGIHKAVNSVEYNSLKKKYVPPYDKEKFSSKWKKLRGDAPSHTVVAHLSMDTYSHIHPREPRGISAREAARLQSFPDDFIFKGNMGDAFRQIGNAVPPLLSYAVAKSLRKSLGR